MQVSTALYLVLLGGVIALAFAYLKTRSIYKKEVNHPVLKEVSGHIAQGAMAFLSREYRVLTPFILAVAALLGVFNQGALRWQGAAFLLGCVTSGLAGYLGMKVATAANARTAQAAKDHGLPEALGVAFSGGTVMGMSVVGLALVGLFIVIFAGIQLFGQSEDTFNQLILPLATAFSLGASSIALFSRVGGGIFTKAADVGADLVGKVEAGIPEDDPRNPATIADNVGDNVGDVAGMGADLYESYAGSILATAALGAALPLVAGGDASTYVLAPMIVAAIGIVLSIVGIFLVRAKESATQKNLLNALLLGTGGSSLFILIAIAIMAAVGWISWGLFGSVVAGLAAGVIIGQSTEYFTSDEYKPTRGIARQALQGPATTIIDGMAVGMFSTWIPVLTIVLGIIAAFGFAGGFSNYAMGVYGIGFAAVGMLSTLGITLATDAFGPIADNAGGNAEMAHLPKEVRERTDALDMLGNTTAATGKGFAIGSAALTAMALLAAYMEEVRLWLGKLAANSDGIREVGDVVFYTAKAAVIPVAREGQKVVELATANIRDFSLAYDLSVFNPLLLGGIFIGAMMAFVFCAMTMKAVGRAAGAMVDEVRRQFREIAGIMEGTATPEYAKCVEISTKGAQREMIVPSLMAIIVPIAVGIFMGVPGVIGLLVGGLTAGFTLASMLNNAGGAWDNAKKYIEKGNFGGKGSEAHKAGVVGDTVGDPFKDTSGPSLNILIKLMSMVSVVMAGLTISASLW